jgi:polyisoprenoid-binding protein YceI
VKDLVPPSILQSSRGAFVPDLQSAGYLIRKRSTPFVSSSGRRIALLTVAAGVLAGAAAGADGPAWQVTRADVRIILPMKPGGAFDAKTTALSGRLAPGSGKPLPLEGALEVDLGTIDTGIALRNRHMRENYLEVQKGEGFDKARLTDLRLTDADGPAFVGRTGFTGTLLIHGVPRPISGTAEIRPEGTGVRVVADFPLSLSDFAIPPPEYLGVGVANRILLKVSFSAAPAAPKGGVR